MDTNYAPTTLALLRMAQEDDMCTCEACLPCTCEDCTGIVNTVDRDAAEADYWAFYEETQMPFSEFLFGEVEEDDFLD